MNIRNQAVTLFKDNGFTLEKIFNTDHETFGMLERTHYVVYKGKRILQIQENDNGTFNTFEHLRYPTSFNKDNFNITLDQAISIAKSAAENILDEQLTLF